MPINMWTQDQVPELTLRGAESLGRGIGSLGQSGMNIAAILDEKRERSKQESQLTTALRKTISIAYPDMKDWANMATKPDLEGFLKGKALEGAAQEMRTEQEFQRERMLELRAAGEARNRLGNFNTAVAMNPSPFPPTGPELIQLAAGAGVLGDRSLDIDALLKAQETGGLAPEFIQDKVSGSRFVINGRSILPSGFDPSVDLPTEDIELPGGEKVKVVRTRSGLSQLRPTTTRTAEQKDLDKARAEALRAGLPGIASRADLAKARAEAIRAGTASKQDELTAMQEFGSYIADYPGDLDEEMAKRIAGQFGLLTPAQAIKTISKQDDSFFKDVKPGEVIPARRQDTGEIIPDEFLAVTGPKTAVRFSTKPPRTGVPLADKATLLKLNEKYRQFRQYNAAAANVIGSGTNAVATQKKWLDMAAGVSKEIDKIEKEMKGKEIPTITTQEEYDALDSGDFYYEEDGVKYRKP